MKVDVASLYLRPLFGLRHEFASSSTVAATPKVQYLFVRICACRSRRRTSDPLPRLVSKEEKLVVVMIYVPRHGLQAAAPATHDGGRGCHCRILGAWGCLHL